MYAVSYIGLTRSVIEEFTKWDMTENDRKIKENVEEDMFIGNHFVVFVDDFEVLFDLLLIFYLSLDESS